MMDNSPEYLKLCAARDVYAKENRLGKYRDGVAPPQKKEYNGSWVTWWNKKFNDDFYSYIAQLQSEKE